MSLALTTTTRRLIMALVALLAAVLPSVVMAPPADAHSPRGGQVASGVVVHNVRPPVLHDWRVIANVDVRANRRSVSKINGVCTIQLKQVKRVWKVRRWRPDGWVNQIYWDTRGRPGILDGNQYAEAEPWAAAIGGTHTWRATCTIDASGPDGAASVSVVSTPRTIRF
ncbi:hypothetical protein CYG49_05095 [Candidatus Saccharibacteria bacterium]|nr:MAG: hypothetical protein CYG49_05095 [Candidatus Saccharibacteria bacterium]